MKRFRLYLSALSLTLLAFSFGSAWAVCEDVADFGDAYTTMGFSIDRVAVYDGDTAFSIILDSNVNGGKLYTLDVSGTIPATTDTTIIGPAPRYIQIDGDYAYILHDYQSVPGCSYSHLSVVDISNPSTPTIVYNDEIVTPITNSSYVQGLAVKDGWLWLILENVPYVYDVSTPSYPVRVGTANPTNHHTLQGDVIGVCEDHIYIAADQSDGADIPTIRIYGLDPADNNVDASGNLLPQWNHTVLNSLDSGIHSLLISADKKLYVSLTSFDASIGFSGLFRYTIDLHGGLSGSGVVAAGDDETYNLHAMTCDANYFYGKTFHGPVRAIDTSSAYTLTEVAVSQDNYDRCLNLLPNGLASRNRHLHRICDQPVLVNNSDYTYVLSGPDGPIWNFTWDTEEWTEPSLDVVYVFYNGHDPDCGQGLIANLTSADPDVEVTVTYDEVNDVFTHHLSAVRDDCINCSYTWVPLSWRIGQCHVLTSAFTFNVTNCIPRLNRSLNSGFDSGDLSFELAAPSPNPFNPTTKLSYHLPVGVKSASLSIHDISGRLIKRLVGSENTPGWHEATWQGRNDKGEKVASGIYFARLEMDGQQARTQRLVMLK